MDLIQLQKNLKEIVLNDILDDSVMATKDAIINHNKTQMLFGKATDGSILGRYKWESYADEKAKYFASYHAPYGVYNFSLYGDFHEAMYVRPLLTAYEIGSTDKKTEYLESLAGGGNKKLGAQRTFGLSKEDFKDYCETNLKPELKRRIWDALRK